MNLFDVILLIVILIGFLLGYKRGFFGSITKPLKLIASASLTIVISSPIINAWTRPFFTEKIQAWIYKSLVEACEEKSAEMAEEAMPAVLKFLAELLKIDTSSLGSGATTDEILTVMAEQMAAPAGNLVAVVVTYALMFIAFMLILTVLIALLDTIFTTGFLGKINKVLGLLLGGVIAMVVACILANIVGTVSQAAVSGAISQFFKNINPFSLVMKI